MLSKTIPRDTTVQETFEHTVQHKQLTSKSGPTNNSSAMYFTFFAGVRSCQSTERKRKIDGIVLVMLST